MNKKKIKKIGLRSIIGVLTFGVAAVGAYMVTPSKVRSGLFNGNEINNDGVEEEVNHFAEFVNQFSIDTGITDTGENTGEKEYYGLDVEFENFSVSFTAGETENAISLLNDTTHKSGLQFLMRGLKDINFVLNADIDYNNRFLPVNVSYVNSGLYFGLKDLRIKATSSTLDELIYQDEDNPGLIYKLFMEAIDLDVEYLIDDIFNGVVDSLFGMIDLSSMSNFSLESISDDQEGIGLDVVENQLTTGDWKFDLTVQINSKDAETGEMDNKNIALSIVVSEDYRLKYIDLGTIDLGSVVIKGALKIDALSTIKDGFKVYAPDDDNENNKYYNSEYTYVEVISYKGWLEKLANFLGEDNQKIGVEFTFDLDSISDDSTLEIGAISGSINADFSELLDFSDYRFSDYDPDYEEEDNHDEEHDEWEENSDNSSEDSSENKGLHRGKIIADDIKSAVELGIELKVVGQDENEYANMIIKYDDGQGYININESEDDNGDISSVLKAKIDNATMNWILEELPAMFSTMGGEGTDTEAVSSLFSFITDSTLVSGIKKGDYSVILDMISEFSNDNSSINIGLSLDSLGLGSDSSVTLKLNSSTGQDDRVLNLDISNVELGSFALNASVHTEPYKQITIGEESTYDSLSYLPTIVDQVSGILDSKQAGFSIEGSLLDSNNLGIKLDGQGQFDYGERYGFGDLSIEQYKYKANEVWYTHQISLDVRNEANTTTPNNVYFIYGEPDNDDKNIKGKVTIDSILDMVDVVKTFISDNKDNEKYTKFIEPIMSMAGAGKLADIISSKDYFRLLKNDLVKSAHKDGQNLNLVIGGSLFEMESDITIRVTLSEEDKLESVEIINLVISGKTLNLKVSLQDFDSSRVSPIDRTGSFMDLSSISLLLEFGLNTTKNNYYHLTADIDLSAVGGIINLDFTIDVKIVVDGEYVKIYGVIADAKLSSLFQDYGITAKSVKSEFTFETYSENDSNKDNGIGGYFHFKTTVVRVLTGRTEIRHFKTTSQNLLDGDNLLTYLLEDFLYVKSSIIDSIGGLSLSSDEEKEAGNFTNLFTDTGFKYDESAKRWDIGLNLDELTGIEALQELELSLYADSNNRFTRLKAQLNIKALFVTLNVVADIKLESTDPNASDWDTSTEAAFTAINNVYFSSNYLNKPNKYLSK